MARTTATWATPRAPGTSARRVGPAGGGPCAQQGRASRREPARRSRRRPGPGARRGRSSQDRSQRRRPRSSPGSSRRSRPPSDALAAPAASGAPGERIAAGSGGPVKVLRQVGVSSGSVVTDSPRPGYDWIRAIGCVSPAASAACWPRGARWEPCFTGLHGCSCRKTGRPAPGLMFAASRVRLRSRHGGPASMREHHRPSSESDGTHAAPPDALGDRWARGSLPQEPRQHPPER